MERAALSGRRRHKAAHANAIGNNEGGGRLRASECQLLSPGFKLFLWRFTFLNYTKSTKYEAEEPSRVVEGTHEGGAKAARELDSIIARAVASKTLADGPLDPFQHGINLGHAGQWPDHGFLLPDLSSFHQQLFDPLVELFERDCAFDPLGINEEGRRRIDLQHLVGEVFIGG